MRAGREAGEHIAERGGRIRVADRPPNTKKTAPDLTSDAAVSFINSGVLGFSRASAHRDKTEKQACEQDGPAETGGMAGDAAPDVLDLAVFVGNDVVGDVDVDVERDGVEG